MFYPLERAHRVVQINEVDAAMTTSKVDGDGSFYSDEYIYYINTVVCNKEKGLKAKKFTDFAGINFASFRGAHWVFDKQYAEVFNTKNKKYLEPTSLEALNLIFWSKRVDCIAISKYIFKWFKKYELKKQNLFEFPVEYFNLFDRRTYFHLKFSNKKLRDQFNIGLKKIKNDNTIYKIYKKYFVNADEADLKW